MAVYQDKKIENETVVLDGSEFVSCEFHGCRMVYRGGEHPRLQIGLVVQRLVGQRPMPPNSWGTTETTREPAKASPLLSPPGFYYAGVLYQPVEGDQFRPSVGLGEAAAHRESDLAYWLNWRRIIERTAGPLLVDQWRRGGRGNVSSAPLCPRHAARQGI